MELICDLDDLERTVGARSKAALLKSIDVLDAHVDRMLSLSPLAVLGYATADGTRRAALVGGAPGFAAGRTAKELALPLPAEAADGASASLLCLIPGWRETFRINGTIRRDAGVVAVEEAFVHCAKAIIRSALWGGPLAAGPARSAATREGSALDDAEARAFLDASPFAVVTSLDGAGAADASPKGDPGGFIQVLDDTTIAIPDRPGNRRTDTLHNVVERPDVALVALIPGDHRSLELHGAAQVSKDPGLLAGMAVRDRQPKAALVVRVAGWRLVDDPALRASAVWDPSTQVPASELPDAARIWTDHVKANDTPGLAARLARASINSTVMRRGAEADYKRNLY